MRPARTKSISTPRWNWSRASAPSSTRSGTGGWSASSPMMPARRTRSAPVPGRSSSEHPTRQESRRPWLRTLLRPRTGALRSDRRLRFTSTTSLRSMRRTGSSFCACRCPPEQPAVHLAHQCPARRQLAGARDTGPVRPQARRPSQSRAAARCTMTGRKSIRCGKTSTCTPCCRRSRASGISSARSKAKACSRSRWGRCMRASSSRATSFSASPASRCSTSKSGSSTRTRARRSCSRTSP